MNSSLETMVSRSHHWLHQFQLVTEHSLKGATNYGHRATSIGTKQSSMLSWDQDRNLGLQVSRPRQRRGQNELECTRVSGPWSRDHNTANHVRIYADRVFSLRNFHNSASCVQFEEEVIVRSLTLSSIPRDAMRKHGLCCRPVSLSLSLSVRPSVCHVEGLYPEGWRYRQISLSAR